MTEIVKLLQSGNAISLDELSTFLRTSTALRVLEPRVVFDGAAAPAVAEAVADSDVAAESIAGGQGADGATSNSEASPPIDPAAIGIPGDSNSVVFIDGNVPNPGALLAAVPAGSDIVLLDPSRDGLSQIAEYLSGRSGVSAVHILSHGEAGELHLGFATVTAASIASGHADELAAIKSALSADADILIYGCNVAAGANGQAFIAALSDATGADVAASIDDTGLSTRGGDWDLETRTGLIEAGLIDAREWNGLLAPLTISTTLQPTVTGATGPNAITGLLEGGVGFTALWTNAGTIGSTGIDIRATVTSLTASTVSFFTQGDDPSIVINGGATATIKWEIFAAGTSQTIVAVGSPNFRISDIDGVGGLPNTREIVRPQLNGLTGYTVDSPTNLVAAVSAGGVQVSGTQNQNGEATSLTAFTWQDVSTWQVEYTLVGTSGFLNAVFRHDGDGDFTFVAPNTVNLLSIDLDGNNSAASGTSYQASYVENGAGVRVVDFNDIVITQNAVLGTNLGSASVVLTNAKPGDILTVGALPSGISATVDTSVSGVITVTLSGSASVADYQDALEAITFSNSSDAPDTTSRQIEVSVTNAAFSTTSNTALSTILVTSVNDAPEGTDQTITTNEDTAHTFTAADFGFTDPAEGNAFQSVTIQPLTGGGLLTYQGNPVTAATLIPVANISQLVYTPAVNANGTGLASLDFQVADNGGTANAGQDTDQSPNTFTFNVTTVNDAPAGIPANAASTDGQSVTIDAGAAFTDVDSPDIDFTISGLPAGLTYDPETGVISGTLGPNVSQGGLNPMQPGVYTITVDASDGTATTTSTFTFTVTNPVPVAFNDSGTTNENAVQLLGNVKTNDHDGGLDSDLLTVTAGLNSSSGALTIGSEVTLPSGAKLTLNSDGTYTYKPNGAFESLDLDESTTDTFTYTISDGQGGTSTATVTITIDGRNDAPQVGTLPNITGQDGDPINLNFGALFSDPDVEPLTFTISGLPAGLTYNPSTGVVSGTIDFSASQNGLFAAPGGGSIYIIQISVSDGDSEITRTFQYKVTNPAPDAQNDARNVSENGPAIGGSVLSNNGSGLDVDGGTDGDVLIVTDVNGSATNVGGSVTGSTGGVFMINTDGSFSFDPAGAFEDLETGETRTTSVTYTISDGQGGTDTATVTVTVTGVNDPATISLNGGPTVFGSPDADYATTYVENAAPVAVMDPAAYINDFGENDVYTLALSLSGFVDGGVEKLSIGNATLSIGTGGSLIVTIGSTTFNVIYNPGFNLVTIEKVGYTPIAIDDLNTLMRAITYEHTSNNPTAGVRQIGFFCNEQFNSTTDYSYSRITVEPANDPPVAVDDSANVAEDGPSVSGNVITGAGTDSDVDGGALSVTLAEQAGNPITIGTPFTVAGGGVLTLNGDGSYTFAPGTAYNGLDAGETATETVQYTISDCNGGTATALLVITINGANDTPVVIDPANPGTATNPIPASDPLNIIPDVTTNDGTALTPINVAAFIVDPDGEALTFTLDPATTPSWVVIDPVTGILTGTPPADASQLSNTGTPGEYLLTLTATDPDGALVTTTVTLTIINLPPVAVDDTGSVSEDGPAATGNVLGNDADTAPDADPLTVVAINGDPAIVGAPVAGSTGGMFTLNADGSWSFDPGADFQNLAIGETRDTVITYRVADGQGGTADATITISVNGANDAPVALGPIGPQTATDSVVITPIDTSVAFANPNALPLTYTATNLPEGLVIDPATGIITGTPARDASVQGPYVVTITATGPAGETSLVALQINVVNPAPVADNDNATTPLDTPVTIAPLANDSDPDGDALTITAVTPAVNGTATLNTDGTINYVPNTGFTGVETITYTVSDGQGGTTTATIMITVGAPPADAPVLTGTIPAQTGTDGAPITPIDAGTLVTDPNGGPLNFTATGLPPGLVIDPVTGLITGTLEPDASVDGPYTVTVTAVDPDGNQVTITFVLAVLNPATIAANDATSTPLDTPIVIGVLGNDHDPDGDVLVISATSDPANGTVVINADGTITYTPDAGFTGTDTFTYTVSDGEGGFSIATVTVAVAVPLPGQPEAIAPLPATASGVDSAPITPIDLGSLITDPTGQPLTFAATGLPEGLTIDPVTGIITGTLTPNASVEGPFTVTVTAVDPDGHQLTTTLVLTATNPVPVAGDDQATTPAEQSVVIGVLGNDSDPDGDTLTVTAATDPANGEVVIKPDGTITYTPDAGFIGTDTFVYTITDANGASITAIVMVNVGVPGPLAASPAITPVTGTDGGTITPVTVTSAFGDPDQTGPLTLSIDPATGAFSGTSANNASQGSTPGEPAGTYIVPVTATDANGATTTTYVTFSFVNLPPVAVDDGEFDALPGITNVYSVLGNDHDTAPDSDPVSVVLATAANGTVTINPDGSLSYKANPGFVGADVITYTISDGNGGTATAQVAINVLPEVHIDTDAGNSSPADIFHPAITPFFIESRIAAPPIVVSSVNDIDNLNGIGQSSHFDGSIDIETYLFGQSNGHFSLWSNLSTRVLGEPQGMVGFSLRDGIGAPFGALGGLEDGAQVTISSFVRGRIMMLNLETAHLEGGVTVESWRVTSLGGEPRPDWLDQTSQGFIMGEHPAGLEKISLDVTVTLSDGREVTKSVEIELKTGEIKQLNAGKRTDAPLPFDRQFKSRAMLHDRDIGFLGKALKKSARG